MSFTQNIYNVGYYSGSAKACKSAGNSSLDIYSIGINDGFARICYSQEASFLDIYSIGINDGFAKDCYSSGTSQLDIYSSNNFDGVAFSCTQKNIPLPVIWLNFSAKLFNNNDVLLSWTTTLEINNDYFILQRSEDAVNWEPVSIINGVGNSSEPVEYSFIDNEINSGTYYYRLLQYDYDNNFNISKIISIKIYDFIAYEAIQLHILPNPVTTRLYVYGTLNDDKLFLYDINGILVLKTNNNIIDMTIYKKGFYILKVKRKKSSNEKTFKIIKK